MVTNPEHKALFEQPASTHEFMHDIINKVYPRLFTQINDIISEIRLLLTHHSAGVLLPLAEKVSNEMDNLYRMENEVLFPFITTLAEENKKSESCKLFKDAKVHYTAMLKYITELKECLKICNTQDGNAITVLSIITSLLIFEQQHVFLQVTKNKYLFAPFKSCTGCKVI